MAWPVALYVPNLIGYVRIVTGLAALAVARDPAKWASFFWLYAVSYSLDAVDGVAARRLGQTSRLGAVLDMVTDRFCTAGLLCTLSALYPAWSTTFVCLMVLDIVSHWAQMFSSMAAGFGSHKAVSGEAPLLAFYYTFPYALFGVCLLSESFLAMTFLLAHEGAVTAATPGLVVSWPSAVLSGPIHLVRLAAYACFPVFALKQVISVVQLATAFRRIAALDESERAAKAAVKSK